jgi:hypothetical protein
MAAGKRVNEFSRDYPLWYYARSRETCLARARRAGRARRLDVDAEPQVRVNLATGKVTLTWPQPVEAAA